MKLLLTTPIVDLNGKVLNNDLGEPFKLRGILINALLAAFQDEQNLSGEDKLYRWKLANKINDSVELEVKAEDIVLLKKLVAKAYAPIISGQVWEILEPSE